MSKIYLPHASQFDLMNENLAIIANALCADMDITSWAGIQKAVRIGVAPALIPVGTQLTVNHTLYGDMVFDVVAHNHFESAYDKNIHTMTLMAHDALISMQFDNAEAFYYAENELPAGTYNFTLNSAESAWSMGTYQFTLTKNLPKGGQLCIGGTSNVAITTLQVRAFNNSTVTTATESVGITMGNSGVSLGAFGAELNHAQRVSYGSNNYKESAIRQFLNSSAKAGSVWTPQTKYDRPPNWMTSLAGFANGLDDEFLSVVGKVVVPCATNSIYESLDSTTVKNTAYTVIDKFYLASQNEIIGIMDNTINDHTNQFSYYVESENADRIKHRDDSAVFWCMRSAYSWDGYYIRIVDSDGSLNRYYAVSELGCVPVCTIV